MDERRRGARHTLAQPGMGTMSVVQDVEITYLDAHDCVVIASQPIPRGERLLLSLPDPDGGESYTRLARAVDSRVALRGGALRREVMLLIAPRSGEAADTNPPFASHDQHAPSMSAALMRRVPVRIVQVSYSGCLWEAPSPLDEGTVGFVDLRRSGHHQSEAVRILRTMRSDGSNWPHQMAVEFLTLFPLSPESIRGVAAMVAAGAPFPHRH